MISYDSRERYRNTGLEAYIGQEVLIECEIYSSSPAPGCAPDDPWKTYQSTVRDTVRLEAVEKEGIRTSGRYYYFYQRYGLSDNESPVGYKGGTENHEQIVQVGHRGVTVYKYGNGTWVGFGGTLQSGQRVDDY